MAASRCCRSWTSASSATHTAVRSTRSSPTSRSRASAPSARCSSARRRWIASERVSRSSPSTPGCPCWSVRGSCWRRPSTPRSPATRACTAPCSNRPADHRLRYPFVPMSGHSKWSTIKRKKGAADAKRSQLFAKLLRAIEVAAREGGSSVEGNMTLASAVEKARDNSVPWDNIERAIKRGSGAEGGGARYDEVVYEGYAPGGVAILIEALTDNRNRTSQEVRHAFTHGGGNLGDQGSVAWMFTRRGLI